MAEQTNQDQQAAAAQVVQDPGTRQAAPWDSDLARLFEDEGARGVASDYLRENVQPRMTQLEQQYAQTADARQLWNQMQEQPMDVFVSMAHEMFGEEAANKVLDSIQQALASGDPEQQQAAADVVQQISDQHDSAQQAPALTAEQQQAIEWANQQRIETAYNAELSGLKERNPDITPGEIDKFIHPWVNMAGGNFDRAMALYRDYRTQYGVPATSQEIADAAAREGAPVVVGGEGQVSATAPVNEVVTMQDAYESLARDLRANREAPRTVGSV